MRHANRQTYIDLFTTLWGLSDADGAALLADELADIRYAQVISNPFIWSLLEALAERDTQLSQAVLARLDPTIPYGERHRIAGRLKKLTEVMPREREQFVRFRAATPDEREAEVILLALLPRDSDRQQRLRAVLARAMAYDDPKRALALLKTAIDPEHLPFDEIWWRLYQHDPETAINELHFHRIDEVHRYIVPLLNAPSSASVERLRRILQRPFDARLVVERVAALSSAWPEPLLFELLTLVIGRLDWVRTTAWSRRYTVRPTPLPAMLLPVIGRLPVEQQSILLEQLFAPLDNSLIYEPMARGSLRELHRLFCSQPATPLSTYWQARLATARRRHLTWCVEQRYRVALRQLTTTNSDEQRLPTVWVRRLAQPCADPNDEATRRRLIAITARVLARHG